MADIMMCNNKECKLKLDCYRYLALPDKRSQSYMLNPVKDCENNNYIMYVDMRSPADE